MAPSVTSLVPHELLCVHGHLQVERVGAGAAAVLWEAALRGKRKLQEIK